MKFTKPTKVWSEIKDGITQVWGPAPTKTADYIIIPIKGYKIIKDDIIHKAVTPKNDYCNPTLCCAKMTDSEAKHKSRTSWKQVTCKKCLNKRRK